MSEFLIAETNDAGEPNLAGKRRLSDTITDAIELADEIDGTVFALEAVEVAPFDPVPAVSVRHIHFDDLLFIGGVS